MSGDIKKLLESIDSLSEQNDFPRQAMDYGTGMKPRAESDHAAMDQSNYENDPRWDQYNRLQSQQEFTQARELLNRIRYEHHMDESLEEGIFDMFKKRKEPELQVMDDNDLALIKSVDPHVINPNQHYGINEPTKNLRSAYRNRDRSGGIELTYFKHPDEYFVGYQKYNKTADRTAGNPAGQRYGSWQSKGFKNANELKQILGSLFHDMGIRVNNGKIEVEEDKEASYAGYNHIKPSKGDKEVPMSYKLKKGECLRAQYVMPSGKKESIKVCGDHDGQTAQQLVDKYLEDHPDCKDFHVFKIGTSTSEVDEAVNWSSFKRWYDSSPKDVITRARKSDTNFLKNVVDVDPRDLGGAAKLQWMAARKELQRRGEMVPESFKGKNNMIKESMWDDEVAADPVVICMRKDGHKMYFKEFHSNGNYYWTANKEEARDFDTEDAANEAIRMIKAHDPAVYKMGLVGKTHGEKPYPIFAEPMHEMAEDLDYSNANASPLTHGIDNLDMEEDWSADEYNRQKMIDAPKSRQHNPVSAPGKHDFVPTQHALDEEDDDGQDEIIQDLSGHLQGEWPLGDDTEMEDSPMDADPDSVIDEYYSTMQSKGIEKMPVSESSAPGQEAWIKANKARFVKEYGKKKGLEVLYATAWKRSKKNESVNEGSDSDICVGDWVSWSGTDGMNVVKRHGKVVAVGNGKVKVDSEFVGTKVLPLNKVKLHQKAEKVKEAEVDPRDPTTMKGYEHWGMPSTRDIAKGLFMKFKGKPITKQDIKADWMGTKPNWATRMMTKPDYNQILKDYSHYANNRGEVYDQDDDKYLQDDKQVQAFESMFAEAMDTDMSKQSKQINESFDLTDSNTTKKIVDSLGSMMKLAGVQSQYQGMTPVVSEDLSATLTMSKTEDGKSMNMTICDPSGDEIDHLLSLAGIAQPKAVAVVSTGMEPTNGEAPEQADGGYQGGYEVVGEAEEKYENPDKDPTGEYGDTHYYDNMPKKDVYDLDTQINKGSDLNAPKGEYAKEFPGDNRMDIAKRNGAFEHKSMSDLLDIVSEAEESNLGKEFSSFADQMKSKWASEKKPSQKPVSKETKPQASREELESELKRLEAEFDPNFEYSDDHSVWHKQKAIRAKIAGIKKQLKSMTEGEEAPEVGTVANHAPQDMNESKLWKEYKGIK